jgi:hypothetical protein
MTAFSISVVIIASAGAGTGLQVKIQNHIDLCFEYKFEIFFVIVFLSAHYTEC